MSHKVHPKIFRIRGASDWLSRGFYEKNLSSYLREDFIIRKFLEDSLKSKGVEKIVIERFPGKMNVVIFSARPGLIIGRRGGGVDLLKQQLLKILLKNHIDINDKEKKINLEVREIRNPWVSAALIGQWIAQRLEKRIPYRRALKQTLDKVMANKEVQGARIEISGRLNGVEIARRAWLAKGRLPRQTIRANIDYVLSTAHCSYGVIGIKVWVYKGDI